MSRRLAATVAQPAEEPPDWTTAEDRAIDALLAHSGQPKDVLLLIDVSGSMNALCSTSQWQLSCAGEAAWAARRIVTEGLQEGDMLLVGEFDTGYRLRTETLVEPQRLDTRMLSVPPSRDWGTNCFYGHHAALRDLAARKRPDTWPCIIIISDGYADPPRPPDTEALALYHSYSGGDIQRAYLRDAYVFGNTLGIGVGVCDGVMRTNLRPVTFPPAPTNGALVGRLRDGKTNAVLAGAALRASLQGGTVQYDRQSDAAGFFAFAGVPAGSYDLSMIKSGYANQTSGPHSVQAGMVTDCGFVTMSSASRGPAWAVLVLLGLFVLLVLVIALRSMLLRRGQQATGSVMTITDQRGRVRPLRGTVALRNLVINADRGTIRMGSGDYQARLGARALLPDQEITLTPGRLVVLDRTGNVVEEWTIN
ncbi:MAG: carboxypeptidase regulatory-like domain-containing protein [Armatimonadetes bacterium]|nr:carboxypeptidase regulatory-like domain-containing protein [Armatimonadota bacterium]